MYTTFLTKKDSSWSKTEHADLYNDILFLQSNPGRHIPSQGGTCRGIKLRFLKGKIDIRRNVSVLVSLRGMLSLIWVDTFRSQQFWFSDVNHTSRHVNTKFIIPVLYIP